MPKSPLWEQPALISAISWDKKVLSCTGWLHHWNGGCAGSCHVLFLKNNTDLNLFRYNGKENFSLPPCLLMRMQEERAVQHILFTVFDSYVCPHMSFHSFSRPENKPVGSLKIYQLPSIIPSIYKAGVESVGAWRWLVRASSEVWSWGWPQGDDRVFSIIYYF